MRMGMVSMIVRAMAWQMAMAMIMIVIMCDNNYSNVYACINAHVDPFRHRPFLE
jgi:hypothetical protein